MRFPSAVLLDTHCWLWITSDPRRLSVATRSLVSNPQVELLVSAVVSWEIAIKSGLGKLDLPEPAASYMESRLERHRATPLAVEHSHALGVADLPRHHRDPFDRLLIAQARALGVPLLTADHALADYDVDILWADLEPGQYAVHEPTG